jgi:hypothetical protein
MPARAEWIGSTRRERAGYSSGARLILAINMGSPALFLGGKRMKTRQIEIFQKYECKARTFYGSYMLYSYQIS